MRYVPGKWYGLVAESGCVILPETSDMTMVTSVWEAFRSGVGFAAVLQCVISSSGSSLTDLGSFAVILIDKGAVHMAVRGPLEVTATSANGSTTFDGRGVATWREEFLAEVVSLRVTHIVDDKQGRGGNAALLPIVAGVVTTSELILLEDLSSQGADGVAQEGKAEKVPDVAPAKAEPRLAAEEARPAIDAPVAPAPPSPVIGVPPVVGRETASPAPAVFSETGRESGSTTLMPETDYGLPDDKDEPLHSTTFFSNLWADAPGTTPSVEPVPATGFIQAPVANGDEHDGMTILGMDSFGPQNGSDDHDGMTILNLPGQGAQTPLPYPPPPSTGPIVLARLCPACRAAHSTRTVTCKKCGAALSGDAVRVPRPALGRVQLPDGEIVAIEHPMIVGRRPEAGRFSYSDLPVVVKVDDPHVSSTHLKIDLEDWSVLVTNLGRNGTILRRAGQVDRGLSDAEQVIAQLGDQFILGPGISVTIVELA